MMEDDMALGGLKDLPHLQPFDSFPDPSHTSKFYSKQWSMVVIRDSSSPNTNDAAADDFSVFPPDNHENLTPSHFVPDLKNPPPSPLSPLSFPPSDSDLPSSPSPSPPPSPPPPQSSVSTVPRWWGFALQVMRSKIFNFGRYFGYNGSGAGNRSGFWSLGNVSLAMMVVVWWLSVRIRRRWRRRESVGHLLQVIKHKDEKIIQLLNQIAQMNELLLARHKVQAS